MSKLTGFQVNCTARTLCLVLMACVGGASVCCASAVSLSNAEILDDADARIELYRKADASLALSATSGSLPVGTQLRIAQQRHAFLFGCCTQWLFSIHSQENRIETQPELARAYTAQFADLFNFCTTQVYWGSYERSPGAPQHDITRANIEWARSHGMAVKGHPLAWNYVADPHWLRGADNQTILDAQLARIRRELTAFPGLMWDVVNESAGFDRESARRGGPGLTKVMEELGPAPFVRRMYEEARKADPTATLLTNDYLLTDKYDENGIAPLINDDGTALFDAIGIQSHMHGGVWTPEKIWDACERYAKYNKPLHFTEVTIISGDPADRQRKQANPSFPWKTTPEGEAYQADAVAQFYSILFSHPSVEAITWWNFTDNQAWQGAPAGLIRADMTPKPAYDRLKQLVKGKWWTEIDAKWDGEGPLAFRGFVGEYAIEARTPEGGLLMGNFTLPKSGGTISVRLSQ